MLLGLLIALAGAKKDKPDVSTSKFETPLNNLFYFDNTDVIIAVDPGPHVAYRSTDAGANWKEMTAIDASSGIHIRPHPYNNKVAVAMSMSREHWVTQDQGETWVKFETQFPLMATTEPIVFHPDNPKKIIFLTQGCPEGDCTGQALFTTDGGENVKVLREKIIQCAWSKMTDVFTTGNEEHDKDQTICIAEGKYSHYIKDNRLVVSNDYFDSEHEPPMDEGRLVQGHVNLAAVKGFVVSAAKSEGSLELVLYVSDDVVTWHRAVFDGHRLEDNAYTLLESTNYSIQLDALTTRVDSPMGTLFTSNSNGTYFTRNIAHTNRDRLGIVDFEKIQNIQGLVLVNTVENWEDVQRSGFIDRELVTKMSFDDGRTWHNLKVKDENLHLHSVTSQRNSGRIFSSPAPGIVMGVGSTGKYLKEWSQCDTYISDDAGVSWRKAMDEPHLYEFGDQGALIVAMKDDETNKIKCSINHGKEWSTYELEDKVRPITLQTAPDSTSLKFLLVAIKDYGSKAEYVSIALDFAGLHERECKKADFENWPARVNDKGEPTCVMGHKQFYRRRKADADCFVDYNFKEAEATYEECTCTDADYECDYNFVRDESGEKCLPAGPLLAPSDACKGGAENFKGSSGYRLIPGNVCNKKNGVVKDEPVDRPCKETEKTPSSGKVTHELTKFDDTGVREYYYLERTSDEKGDTVIMQTKSRKVYISHDHGVTWEKILSDEEIVAIYPHQHFKEVVYLITASRKVFYSHNRGVRMESFDAPEGPNTDRVQILSFHPKQKDWLLWIGGKDCDHSGKCHTVAHITTNGGAEWKTLLSYTKKCLFVANEDHNTNEKLVYCEQWENEDPSTGQLNLVASDDWFEHKDTHFTDVVSFATMSEFIVVALRDSKQQTLRVGASIDGKNFADAQFPHNFQIAQQQAYTVLDSSTHAIFLHVTVNNEPEQEYGSIIKSNSNGTSYVLSASHVNRNTAAYVDFEKMQGILGIAVINIVSNVDELSKGAQKKLRTLITHNDGAEWSPLNPPEKDSEGKSFSCTSSNREECALHLHGYTERRDPRNTFSSPSATGLMIAVGNVGPYLGTYRTGDTFITRDGGVTWHEVFKGTYTWEYGDQGSIIVIVKQDTPVRDVYFTRDEGQTWQKYQFSDRDMIVDEISTVPADTSRNFLLWARDNDQLVTINLDFSGLTNKVCQMDTENPERTDSDYYLWTPTHPASEDDCLFGQVSEYFRKKPESDCYNGGQEIKKLHNVSRICECTRQDFEW